MERVGDGGNEVEKVNNGRGDMEEGLGERDFEEWGEKGREEKHSWKGKRRVV